MSSFPFIPSRQEKKTYIQDSRFKIQYSRTKIQNLKFNIQDSRLRTSKNFQHLKSKIHSFDLSEQRRLKIKITF